MAYKCPFCGYIDSLVSFSAQLDGDVQCRQCCLSTSNALLRAQEELVNQFTAYTISHNDLQRPAAVKPAVKHIPFASSAAHSIYIPPYKPSPQANTTSEVGRKPEMLDNSSHQEQMECLPESAPNENDLVEPYMVLGYQEEQRSEQSWRSQEPPRGTRLGKTASEPAYSAYNDPVFNTQQWWEHGGSGKIDYPYREDTMMALS